MLNTRSRLGCTLIKATITLAMLLLISGPAVQAGDERIAVILESLSTKEIMETVNSMKNEGLKVDHVIPPRMIIARGSLGHLEQLESLPGIAAALTGPVQEIEYAGLDALSKAGLKAYDRLYSAGDFYEPLPFNAADLGRDAFPRPPRSSTSRTDERSEPGDGETSEFLCGTVVVGLVLPESNGVQDTSTEDWTVEERDFILAEAIEGLDFYPTLSETADLTFIYHLPDAPPPGGVSHTVECDYEAIQHGMFHSNTASSFLAHLGYDNGTDTDRIYAFVNDIRDIYNADWAYMVKCADDTSGQRDHYTDGVAAAHVAGPDTSMSYHNGPYFPYRFDGVIRHETIHIFGAMDEYDANGTGPSFFWGYLGVVNANSETNDGTGYFGGAGQRTPCIAWNVDSYAHIFCPYTWGQLGWLDGDGNGVPDPIDTAPNVLIDQPQVSGGVVTVTGTATDSPLIPERGHWGDHTVPVSINSVEAVEYRVDGRTWLPATPDDGAFDSASEAFTIVTPPLPDGNYELEIQALNQRDNPDRSPARSEISIQDSSVSNTAPFARFTVQPRKGSVLGEFRLDASASGDLEDPGGKILVAWDFEGDGIYDTPFSPTRVIRRKYGIAGLFQPTVKVKDTHGAESTWTLPLEVAPVDLPPEAEFSVSRQGVHGDQHPDIIFDGSDSWDAETPASLLEFRWDWDDDGEWETPFAAAPVASHTFPITMNKTRHWTVRMEVRDRSGQTAATTRFVWANSFNHPPSAALSTGSTTLQPGEALQLDASLSSDPDFGEVWDEFLEFRWDFDGDGTFETGYEEDATPQHSFASIGSYTVTVEVRDRFHATSRAMLPVAVSASGTDTAPVAAFTIERLPLSPWRSRNTATFRVDASDSWDAEDPAGTLRLRWDWENDGTWDTPFSTTLVATHTYHGVDNPVIRLQVEDSAGLRNERDDFFADEVAPAPPTGLTATAGTMRVVLNWNMNPETDLAGYRVYRRLPDSTGFGDAIADVGSVPEYEDLGLELDGTYIYAVTAYDSSNNESAFSDEVTIIVKPPLVPQNLMRAVGNGVVHLRWDENSDPDLNCYHVYRRESGQEDWTAIAIAEHPTYGCSGLTNGTTYEFAVAAVDMENIASDLSDPVTGTPRAVDTTAPAPPTGFLCAAGGPTVPMSWEFNHEDDIIFYFVLRREDWNPEYEILALVPFNQRTYVDETATPGFSYCFAVKALDCFGNFGEPSEEACITIEPR